MDKRQQWSMRLYKPGEEDSIRALFELSMDKDLSRARWNWLYRDNHTGVFLIGLAEGEDGNLAGQCALLPVRMKVGDDTCLGAQSLDAVVHPAYRSQGIFTRLAAYTYETAAGMGVPLIYGFPNKNSHHLLAHRLDRVDLWDRPPVYVRILDVEAVLRKRLGDGLAPRAAVPLGRAALRLLGPRGDRALPTGCELVPVDRFDALLDALWASASAEFQIAVVRDHEYLNWRYVENPEQEYTKFVLQRDGDVVGYVVLKCETKFGLKMGYVVDLLTLPGEPRLGEALVAAAVEFFEGRQMHIASCVMLGHVSYVRSLKKNGFWLPPQWVFPQELHCSVRSQSESYPPGFITDPGNWYVTWGDHDVV